MAGNMASGTQIGVQTQVINRRYTCLQNYEYSQRKTKSVWTS